MRGTRLLTAALLAGLTLTPGAGTADERALYDARIFAAVPEGDRAYIEGIAYDGTDVYAGTAIGSTGTVLPLTNLGEPSRIFSWDRATGTARAPIVVQGEDTSIVHGLVGLKFDGQGRLYALSDQLGLLRFTRTDGTWLQETVLELPDLPPCSTSGTPCSPTPDDRPPYGNDMTWDANGNMYISDSNQATIWKVTPAGAVTPWFQSAALDRSTGANGLRISPDGTFMAVAVTGPESFAVGPIDQASRVIAVPFPDPSAGEATDLLVLPNGDSADGIAYGQAGDLYVLCVSTNKIYILRSGGDVDVIGNEDLSGGGQMDVPASLVFDGEGALLITNYAWLDGQLPHGSRAVIDVWVDDGGMPEPLP